MNRRAKIVATLGPASSDERVIARMLKAGVDVVRLNLSHGSREGHRRLIRRIRAVAQSMDRQVPVLFDLMGPRYRLGRVAEGQRRLSNRQRVTLGAQSSQPDVPVDTPELLRHLKAGDRVLVDDGLVELKITGGSADVISARVVHGGVIATRKGINLPDTELPFEISAKDRDDLRLAVEEQADFVGGSYVGGPEDLAALRLELQRAGGNLPLVAKLERGRAVDHIDEMVARADAVMVARGDLGVEVPLHRVPVLQKRIVDSGCRHGKPVIVATQMLESMIEHSRPTRAESSDVANAVFDGADALMLSGETAIGAYPVESVRTMVRIIEEAEGYALSRDGTARAELLDALPGIEVEQESEAEGDGSADAAELSGVADSIARAAVFTARHLGVRQIVAFSQSGYTARLIARYRPSVPILVFTADVQVARQLQLLWGVRPLLLSTQPQQHDEVVPLVERHLKSAGLIRAGERLIILMGDPIRDRPLTNLMRIHHVRG